MRFELTTSTLARWRSTTELRPRRETRARFLHALPRRASENLHQNFGAAGTIVRQEPPPGQPLLEGQDLIVTIVPLGGGNSSRLSFDVPDDVDQAIVKVVARDNRGESEVYQGKHKGGEHVDVPVAIQTTTRFRIYVNDVLQEERVVEP